MPISGVSSYLPTMDEFLAHWALVNAALAPKGLTLQGGFGNDNLQDRRDDLAGQIAAVAQAESALQQAMSVRDGAKEAPRQRLTQFRAAVKALLPGTPFEAALPVMPPFQSVASRYERPFQDAQTLWAGINASQTTPGFTPPLTLAGGFTLAQFMTMVAALGTGYGGVMTAQQAADLARGNRDAMLPNIKTRLLQYRQAVVSAFAPDAPLVQSLPAVTPAAGSTPQAVAASGAWDGVMNKGVLTWTASDAPRVSRYAVRTAPGPVYKTRNESTVGHVDPDTLTFDTLAGLVAPGSTALFKVYVVTMEGRQRGSSVVQVTRPA